MGDISIFQDKLVKPDDKDLIDKLDSTYYLWIQILEFVMEKYPNGLAEWNYPGKTRIPEDLSLKSNYFH